MLAVAFAWLFLASAVAPQHDGGHDFDFAFGTWHAHVRRLLPRTHHWMSGDGIVKTRKIWNGKANLEELELPMNGGYLEGLTLRLYDPDAKQWNLYFADAKTGVVGDPKTGQFADGQGVFYSYGLIGGVPTYVRQTYYDTTARSYKLEQAYSYDAGKTWQPNLVASFYRADPASLKQFQKPAADEPPQQHAFDWEIGLWTLRMHRLLYPFMPNATPADLSGSIKVEKIWGGRANIGEVECSGPTSRLEILTLRLYLPQLNQWTIAFASSAGGTLTPPMYGTFRNGRAEFYDQEPAANGRAVLDRFIFFDMTPNSAKDEEGLSEDGGRTWVETFYNLHARVVP